MYDNSMLSYKLAWEAFGAMAMDQPPADRMDYRQVAMEALAGPDAGMVLDNLYKNVMSRASINFGKIPDSQGELTKFAKYKTIADSITLLERQMGHLKVRELAATRELHDNLIRLRMDFTYGFKVDSQFLKTTYNTMVYSLCEMVNLCSVIYIDMLKCDAEGRPYKPEDYSFLILVQNVEKFNKMVKSGEWGATVLSIRKDARNLIAAITVQDEKGAGDFLSSAAGIIGSGGGLAIMKAAADQWHKPAGKVIIVITSLVAILVIIRHLICGFYRGVYKLDDNLKDAEALLKAHMDQNADPSGTTKGASKQLALYNKLVGLRDGIRTKILKADSEGRKVLKASNASDFGRDSYRSDRSALARGGDDFAIV